MKKKQDIKWRDLHSPKQQEFIDKFGGQITPAVYKEAMEFARIELTIDELFEILFFLVAQAPMLR